MLIYHEDLLGNAPCFETSPVRSSIASAACCKLR